MIIWRALVTVPYTLVTDSDSWFLLAVLTAIMLLTFAIVRLTYSEGSMPQSDIRSTILVLLSFVLGTYIAITLGRWDAMRNAYLANVWSSLENLIYLVNNWTTDECQVNLNDGEHITILLLSFLFSLFKILPGIDSVTAHPQSEKLRQLALRYARLCMRLLFLAAQGKDQVGSLLLEEGLATEAEVKVLLNALPGTRCHVVIGWLSRLFRRMYSAGYFGFANLGMVSGNLASLRGGVGAALALVGCPLPFTYVHTIYWTVQMYMVILAIETGIWIAVAVNRRKNGKLTVRIFNIVIVTVVVLL